MIYVASPYSATGLEPNTARDLQYKRFQDALRFTYALTKNGYVAFSPIVYYHQMAILGNMPVDAQFWWGMNSDFLRKADALFVLHLPGWDQSTGVQLEMKVAKQINIPIVHFNKDGQEVKEN